MPKFGKIVREHEVSRAEIDRHLLGKALDSGEFQLLIKSSFKKLKKLRTLPLPLLESETNAPTSTATNRSTVDYRRQLFEDIPTEKLKKGLTYTTIQFELPSEKEQEWTLISTKDGELVGLEPWDAKEGQNSKMLDFLEAQGFQKAISQNLNPYLKEEAAIIEKKEVKGSTTAASTLYKRDIGKFLKSDDGVLLVPDVHSFAAPQAFVEQMMNDPAIKWVAIEAAEDCQGDCTRFIESTSDASVGSFPDLNDYQKHQNFVREDKISPDSEKFDDKTFLGLVEAAKKTGKKLIFMDASRNYMRGWSVTDRTHFFTRNKVWSEKIPEKGRGVVFGGAAHFYVDSNMNVQDFLRASTPDRPIYLLNFSESPSDATAKDQIERIYVLRNNGL